MKVSTIVIIVALVGGGAYFAWKKGYFGQAQQAAANSFAVHFDKGQGLYTSNHLEEAAAELQKAYDLEPKNPAAADALVRLGDCYRGLKQTEKALECYEKCVKEFPDYKMRGQVEKTITRVKELGQ